MEKVKKSIFAIAPSTAMNMLRYCCNVTEVIFGICLNGEQVKEIVEKMKHLRKLEICDYTSIPSKPIIVAAGCASLEKLVLRCDGIADVYDVKQRYLSEWVDVGFQPPNLSIVLYENSYHFSLLAILRQWPQWNSQIPTGHTAYFKLYSTKCEIWDIPSAVHAEFQLDFGQTATYPFVKASNFGLFGFGQDLLLLTNSTNNGKDIHKASVYKLASYSSNLCCNVSNLSFVTDFSATRCGLLSGHLEQLSIACPNLERLNLRSNTSCLESLQGLKNIVNYCHNLRGVNLEDVHVTKIENCIELWEVLSEIKMLNHLRIEMCTMKPFIETDVRFQHSFVQLAVKFVHLKQLELMDNCIGQAPCMAFNDEIYKDCPVMLSHFPSLVYCFAEVQTVTTTTIVDIITKCKHLKYFKCFHWRRIFSVQSLSAVPNKHLQYLDINLKDNGIDEVFMDSVSAHGKLEIVVFSIASVTEAGITALIENSPKLCLFRIHFHLDFFGMYDQLNSLKDTLKRRLMHRKLFNLNGFTITAGCSPLTV